MGKNGQEGVHPFKGAVAEVSSIGRTPGTGGSITGAGQTITLDVSTGSLFVINSTTTDAFTLGAPTNAYTNQEIEIKFKNTSGGVMGTPTFNAVFKTGTFTKPANGFYRVLKFRWDGTNWFQHSDASDCAN